jgi:hypothetical protein
LPADGLLIGYFTLFDARGFTPVFTQVMLDETGITGHWRCVQVVMGREPVRLRRTVAASVRTGKEGGKKGSARESDAQAGPVSSPR